MSWQEQVGKEKRGSPFEMNAAQIDKYVLGIAEAAPRHLDPSRDDYAAPPLSVATVVIPTSGMMLGEVDFGELELARIVHGGIELEFEREVREGDVLTCVAKFDGLEQKSTGSLINFGFDVRDDDDATICRGVTRYFVRGKRKSEKVTAPEPPTEASTAVHQVEEVVPEGQSLLYAEGSGDVFPIHTNKQFAQSVGLPDVILHGMCTLAFSVRAVVNSVLAGDAGRLRKIEVRFSKMVFHGDTLRTRIYADGDGAVRFETDNQDGKPVLKDGRVTFDA